MSSSACFRPFAGMLVLIAATSIPGFSPPALAGETFTVSEQASRGGGLGRVSAQSSVAGAEAGLGAHEFEIVAGNTEETFSIDAGTGALRVVRPELLDYELRSRFELKIRWKCASPIDATRRTFAADLLASNVDPADVMDLFTTSEEDLVTVEVLDVDEPPVIPAQTLTIVQDAADSSADPGRIHATDPDQGDVLNFEAIAGDPDGLLLLDPATGSVAVASGRTVPAGKQVVPLTVRVTDRAGHSDAATVAIRLVGIPAPQVAQTPPAAPSSDPVVTPPVAEQQVPAPVEPVEVPAIPPAVPAVGAAAASPDVPSTAPSHFSRLALWFFLAGVLLGAGVMTTVFRYAGRKTLAGAMMTATTPRNPFGSPRPLPITVTTAEHLRKIRLPGPSQPLPARAPATVMAAVLPNTDEPFHDNSVDSHAVRDESDLAPVPEAAASDVDLALARPVPDIKPASVAGFSTPFGLPESQAEISGTDSQYLIDEYPLDHRRTSVGATDWPAVADAAEVSPAAGELPLEPFTGPTGEWADSSAVDEPPQLVPLDEGDWRGPLDYPVDNSINALPEAVDHLHDAVIVPEAAPLDETPDAAARAAADTVDDVHEAAAVTDAAEALNEARSPLGIDPRVAELRQQLIELFGVPADRPARHEEPPVPELEESAVEFHLSKDVAADSARVDELFDSLRFDLRQDPASATAANTGAAAETSATDAIVLTPLTPESQFARSAQAGPAVRVNKSLVRQEISSLREVANTYARAIVARQTTEKRARIVWLVSGCCMVPLFSGGTYLLTSMPPGILRWLGWVLLTGGAAAFSICLNSFNRLSRLHEDSQAPDEASSTQSRAMSDTAEIEIPKQLAAQSDAASTVPPPPSIEPPRRSAQQGPVDDEVYVHS